LAHGEHEFDTPALKGMKKKERKGINCVRMVQNEEEKKLPV